MSFTEIEPGIWRGSLDPAVGALRELWQRFGADVIVGHPCFRNVETIGRQLREGILGAGETFGGRRVSFVVSDGTLTAESGDTSTLEAALAGARAALAELSDEARARVQVVVGPYEGHGGDRTPGKGSALKMIFDEMEGTPASMLILLDGDLRNDMARWHRVFARVEEVHRKQHGERPFFVTARYARHFVDASITRLLVGPLTTLMGQYVPGGISGDIVLSAGAVAHERESEWSPERRKYGTDISTTFDNIADPETVIWEVYLGAKLHDITDEGKLAVMPGEVIGAALERLLHWEATDGRVTRLLGSDEELVPLEVRGPEWTGISFVDPGYTDVFSVDTKMRTLVDGFPRFAGAIEAVLGARFRQDLERRVGELAALAEEGEGPLCFLGVDAEEWTDLLHRTVAHTLVRRRTEEAKSCLNYLYTAAFLEFVRGRLRDLGLETVEAVRAAQSRLGVPPEEAEEFYTSRVDTPVREMALGFFRRRSKVLDYMRELGGGGA